MKRFPIGQIIPTLEGLRDTTSKENRHLSKESRKKGSAVEARRIRCPRISKSGKSRNRCLLLPASVRLDVPQAITIVVGVLSARAATSIFFHVAAIVKSSEKSEAGRDVAQSTTRVAMWNQAKREKY